MGRYLIAAAAFTGAFLAAVLSLNVLDTAVKSIVGSSLFGALLLADLPLKLAMFASLGLIVAAVVFTLSGRKSQPAIWSRRLTWGAMVAAVMSLGCVLYGEWAARASAVNAQGINDVLLAVERQEWILTLIFTTLAGLACVGGAALLLRRQNRQDSAAGPSTRIGIYGWAFAGALIAFITAASVVIALISIYAPEVGLLGAFLTMSPFLKLVSIFNVLLLLALLAVGGLSLAMKPEAVLEKVLAAGAGVGALVGLLIALYGEANIRQGIAAVGGRVTYGVTMPGRSESVMAWCIGLAVALVGLGFAYALHRRRTRQAASD